MNEYRVKGSWYGLCNCPHCDGHDWIKFNEAVIAKDETDAFRQVEKKVRNQKAKEMGDYKYIVIADDYEIELIGIEPPDMEMARLGITRLI